MPKIRHTYNSYRYSTTLSIKMQYLFSIFLKKFSKVYYSVFDLIKPFSAPCPTPALFNHPKVVVHLAIILFFG